jgi:hypothetical protein
MGLEIMNDLTEVQKEVLRELQSTKDIFFASDKFELAEDTVKFWRQTNIYFDIEYLKALGITRNQERFLYAYKRKLFNISATCKAVRIHRSTYYDWLDKSDTFRRFAHDIKEEVYDNLETIMFKKALEGDSKMLMFIAKTIMRNRGYGDSTLISNVNVNINNYAQQLQKMNLKEIEAEIQLMEMTPK